MEYPSQEELLAQAAKKRRIYSIWLIVVIGLVVLFIGAIIRTNPSSYSEEQIPLDSASIRKRAIERQFNPWDGSHIKLTKYIKDQMHDPNSYDHIETRYWDLGDVLVVQTEFRGKNAFGAIVKQNIKAEVDLNGSILKVFD